MLNPLPEYIKVRSYLFTFAMKNRGQECQIPSENELSAMFGVSRVTVRGAIKGLLKDRLLFTRRGMGTFVNPEYLKSGRFLAAGLLVGNGGHATDQFSPSLFSACQMFGIHPEILFVPDSNTPGRLAEQCRSLDAVLWQFFESPPTDYIQALKEAGIPVLGLSSANHAAAGCDHLAISRNLRDIFRKFPGARTLETAFHRQRSHGRNISAGCNLLMVLPRTHLRLQRNM